MRILAVIGLGVAFLGWILYRLVKGDLKEKKNLDLLKFGGFFFAVWTVVLLVIL